jgi:hypothetical protein
MHSREGRETMRPMSLNAFIAACAAIAATGCVSRPVAQAEAPMARIYTQGTRCETAGCRLVGELEYVGGGAQLFTDEGCYDLAVPEVIHREGDAWNGKRVVVVGDPVARPTDPAMMWFEVRGRRVEGGGCGSRTIFVTSLERDR